MGKQVSYESMIRTKPLTDFVNEGHELSVQCPVCLEYFIAKVNRKGAVKCVECGAVVDL
jgi:ribosomal protein S27E